MGNLRTLSVATSIFALRKQNRLAAGLQMADAFRQAFTDSSVEARKNVSRLNLAWLDLEWGTTAMAMGEGPVTQDVLNRSFETAHSVGASFIAARAFGRLAMIHAADGTTTESLRWLEVNDTFPGDDRLPSARLPRAILAVDRLDEDEARLQLSGVGSAAKTGDFWALHTLVSTWVSLHCGDPASELQEMAALIRRHTDNQGIGRNARMIIDRCAADLLIAMGEVNRVERHLAAQKKAFTWLCPGRIWHSSRVTRTRPRNIASVFPIGVRTLLRDRSEMFMIEAAASLAMGDEDSATKSFTLGHRSALRIGTLLPYLTIPTAVRNHLAERADVQFTSTQTNALAGARQVYPESGQLVVLTQRERVVLEELSRHDKAGEIAESLVVSVHTIKKQMASIYAKLGVHDGATALLRASRLGLSDE